MDAKAPCRCGWAKGEPLIRYHDTEWGVPVGDDQKLYEMLLLEAFQAGLSWRVILCKRESFRQAFDDFDAHKIASYGEDKIEALLMDSGIVRCRRKIQGAIENARVFLQIQGEFGSFKAYLDSYTQGKVQQNPPGTVQTTSPLSDVMAKDLKRRGMKYMGSVTLYSYLQAVGVVNDHEPGCFLANEEAQWKKPSCTNGKAGTAE
ncbi:MAG: DNA-3-methyladenine glycosylase I [Eubacteriales bacterium]|nr:DNA-3-methyladenine glycosylase I [Eubacteriales bacterium]